MITYEGPDIGAQHNQGEFPPCQVLLISDVLIGRNHHIESTRFRGLKKFSVLKLGSHCISTNVRTSCPDRKRRTPTGTFLPNRMCNAVTLGVSHNRLDAIRRNFKLL